MSRSSAGTLSWTPRRIWRSVRSPNQRSTWFSQEELVGVKCRWNRGWAASQALIAGVLWVDRLSQIRCTSSSAGTSASIWCQELLELGRPVPALDGVDDQPGRHVQGGEQGGGPGAGVVVGAPLGHAGHHRQYRLGPVEGLDAGLLVHAEHDGPLRRVQVQPDHVADLLDEQRVAGQLEGVDQVRLEPERPPDAPDSRLRQARSRRPSTPATSGWRLAACAPTCRRRPASTCSSLTDRGPPGRGSSGSPSSRRATNRRRHLPTVAAVTPSLAATWLLSTPSAHAR